MNLLDSWCPISKIIFFYSNKQLFPMSITEFHSKDRLIQGQLLRSYNVYGLSVYFVIHSMEWILYASPYLVLAILYVLLCSPYFSNDSLLEELSGFIVIFPLPFFSKELLFKSIANLQNQRMHCIFEILICRLVVIYYVLYSILQNIAVEQFDAKSNVANKSCDC